MISYLTYQFMEGQEDNTLAWRRIRLDIRKKAGFLMQQMSKQWETKPRVYLVLEGFGKFGPKTTKYTLFWKNKHPLKSWLFFLHLMLTFFFFLHFRESQVVSSNFKIYFICSSNHVHFSHQKSMWDNSTSFQYYWWHSKCFYPLEKLSGWHELWGHLQ